MPSSGVQTCALRSEEHTSELQSHDNLVCPLLLEKKSAADVLATIPTPTGTRGPPCCLPCRRQPVRAGVPGARLRAGHLLGELGELFFFHGQEAPQAIHPFPTRRSSD